ncbi:hypothetical protein M2325_000698 [Methanococcus voltae PS]|uniref:Uncharacterized protein n=1 Tax=Methanococcus voltae PS TaxID=523842 RepID=A0ABT2EVM6_METVO|nr:hypothetical protein [Methanococcus voltae]MCS3922013.1 hypothetical protein [Methanococcus voltae PS]
MDLVSLGLYGGITCITLYFAWFWLKYRSFVPAQLKTIVSAFTKRMRNPNIVIVEHISEDMICLGNRDTAGVEVMIAGKRTHILNSNLKWYRRFGMPCVKITLNSGIANDSETSRQLKILDDMLGRAKFNTFMGMLKEYFELSSREYKTDPEQKRMDYLYQKINEVKNRYSHYVDFGIVENSSQNALEPFVAQSPILEFEKLKKLCNESEFNYYISIFSEYAIILNQPNTQKDKIKLKLKEFVNSKAYNQLIDRANNNELLFNKLNKIKSNLDYNEIRELRLNDLKKQLLSFKSRFPTINFAILENQVAGDTVSFWTPVDYGAVEQYAMGVSSQAIDANVDHIVSLKNCNSNQLINGTTLQLILILAIIGIIAISVLSSGSDPTAIASQVMQQMNGVNTQNVANATQTVVQNTTILKP